MQLRSSLTSAAQHRTTHAAQEGSAMTAYGAEAHSSAHWGTSSSNIESSTTNKCVLDF